MYPNSAQSASNAPGLLVLRQGHVPNNELREALWLAAERKAICQWLAANPDRVWHYRKTARLTDHPSDLHRDLSPASVCLARRAVQNCDVIVDYYRWTTATVSALLGDNHSDAKTQALNDLVGGRGLVRTELLAVDPSGQIVAVSTKVHANALGRAS